MHRLASQHSQTFDHASGVITLVILASLMFALQPKFDVLVFSKTAGFRHDSIEVGSKAIQELGQTGGFNVTLTEDSSAFTSDNLKKYATVVFLNTTGDVLNADQEKAFEAYIRAGGGYVGVHAASDTEYDWPFYGQLVGAYFTSHPAIQQATINVIDKTHPATRHLSDTWVRTDEWYCFKAQPVDHCKVLCKLDTTTYTGHKMGETHPIAWYHTEFKGRAFYTGGGHTKESYAESDFRKHLLGGILWSAGRDEITKVQQSGQTVERR